MRLLFTYISIALKQLVQNLGRSILTMLGIIIGIGSVIFIMTLGESAKGFLLSQITQFGTNVIEASVAGSFTTGAQSNVSLTDNDVKRLEESSLLPEITAISAPFSVVEPVDNDGAETSVSIMADTPAFFEVNNIEPISGRLFTDVDVQSSSRVMVIGETFAKEQFGTTDVMGEKIKVGGTFFTIIGVVEDLDFGFGGFGPAIVFSPITTVRQLFIDGADAHTVQFLIIEFEPEANVDSLRDRIEYELRREHGLLQQEDEPFTIVSRSQALDIFNTVLLGIQAFVSAVAAISLIVGGIGIMNIMLVTVKERTKEIGLRKAIGANQRSVLTQFLVESVVLTTVGGILGILGGLGLSILAVILVNVIQPDWGVQFVFVPNAVFLACGVATTVGLIFGLYPAIKASRLHPIEALRYE